MNNFYFTDPRDGRAYRTVELNGLIWMAENLNYDAGEGCWFYNGKPENGEEYGRLYTWQAAQRACPPGWRLPTDEEWKSLANAYGGYYDWQTLGCVGNPKLAYSALIEGGSDSNRSGFSALLGGWRGTDRSFHSLGDYGYYWSATERSSGNMWVYNFSRISGKLYQHDYYEGFGFSCRCVRGVLL